MKTCFSEEKLIKQFGNAPFLREPPYLSFFHDPLLCSNFKNKNPLILGGWKLCMALTKFRS